MYKCGKAQVKERQWFLISLLLLKINAIIVFVICKHAKRRHDFRESARSVWACALILTHCVNKCNDQNKSKRNVAYIYPALAQVLQMAQIQREHTQKQQQCALLARSEKCKSWESIPRRGRLGKQKQNACRLTLIWERILKRTPNKTKTRNARI